MLEAKGLKADVDFFLAFSPERVDPGNQITRPGTSRKRGRCRPGEHRGRRRAYATTVDRVVGQLDAGRGDGEAASRTRSGGEHRPGQRNRPHVHKMDRCLGRIDAAKTKPFGFTPFYPGPGWADCIPIDPSICRGRRGRTGSSAGSSSWPAHQRLDAALRGRACGRSAQHDSKADQRSRIHLFGVAYKRDVNDMRESPALDVLELLQKWGRAELFRSVRGGSAAQVRC
jgi:UDP-N-acetyl-D-glucosamine dehydrogenase